MSRNSYLVAYDIKGDDKRLRQIHKSMKGYGYALQYSVFLCPLDEMELMNLKTEIADIINHREDSVMIVSLGPQDTALNTHFDFLGVQPPVPEGGPVII